MTAIVYFLALFVCLIDRPSHLAALAVGSCPASSLAFPEQFAAEDEDAAVEAPGAIRFPFLEAGLQIYLHLSIPCDGQITEWRFWSATSQINGLHLAVFQVNTTSNTVQMTSNSYINNVNSNLDGEGWVSWKPQTPIQVNMGDVLGLFYDAQTEPQDISVRSLTLPPDEDGGDNADSSFDTLVFLTRSQELVDAGGLISITDGIVVNRVPALYVMLEGQAIYQEPTTTTTAPLAVGGGKDTGQLDTKQMCSTRPLSVRFSNLICEGTVSVRYYYHSTTKFCREFINCSATRPYFGGFASYKECMETCRRSFGRQ